MATIKLIYRIFFTINNSRLIIGRTDKDACYDKNFESPNRELIFVGLRA